MRLKKIEKIEKKRLRRKIERIEKTRLKRLRRKDWRMSSSILSIFFNLHQSENIKNWVSVN